jgi:hypothetical protein
VQVDSDEPEESKLLVEPDAKEVESDANEVEPGANEVEPDANEIEPGANEVQPGANDNLHGTARLPLPSQAPLHCICVSGSSGGSGRPK